MVAAESEIYIEKSWKIHENKCESAISILCDSSC